MDNTAFAVGMVVLTLGGILLASVLLVSLGHLLVVSWIAFSDKFRAVCKAESLIFEYRKNREEFLEWRAEDGK